MDENSPIGIFDSGMGGLSVLQTARALLPNERFIYYGDTANAPYGTKSPEQVLSYAEEVVRILLAQDVKAICIACNTATGVAVKELRARLSLPIIALEPALKPASLIRRNGKILALATSVTLSQPKFTQLFKQYGEGVIPLPCPGLMDFVERLELDSDALHLYLSNLFAPYKDDVVDAVVLGCTHYIFLKKQVTACFPATTKVIDGNEGAVRQLQRKLAEYSLLRTAGEGSVVLQTSSRDPQTLRKMHELLGAV